MAQKITDIRCTKKGRFSVYLDGEYAFVLHPLVFEESGLKINDDLTEEQAQELMEASSLRMAKDKALNLLSYSSHTKKQLYDKLIRHADEESASQAVEKMDELGLIDDADYARRCAADLANLKGYAPYRIRQELKRRGIDSYLIEDILSEMEFDEYATIEKVIQKKYSRQIFEEKGRSKAVNALLRLGYSYEDIRTVINNIVDNGEN